MHTPRPSAVALFVFATVFALSPRAHAQNATHDAGASPATISASACATDEHSSGGHCCAAGHEWHPGRRRCASLSPAQACELGVADACVSAADALVAAPGFEPDRALELYRRACDGGDRAGCVRIGELGARFEEGRGVAQNTERAISLYQIACSAGAGAACGRLASMAEAGRGMPRDFSRAAGFYRQACVAGDPAGCQGLCAAAARYESGDNSIAQDYAQAAALYGPACEGGEARACAGMARMYQYGFGVQSSASRAADLYDRACEGGVNDACVALGDMLCAGAPGLARDYTEAAQVYQSACDRQGWAACFDLGMMYMNGRGVRMNFDHAMALFQRACRGGYARACAVSAH